MKEFDWSRLGDVAEVLEPKERYLLCSPDHKFVYVGKYCTSFFPQFFVGTHWVQVRHNEDWFIKTFCLPTERDLSRQPEERSEEDEE